MSGSTLPGGESPMGSVGGLRENWRSLPRMFAEDLRRRVSGGDLGAIPVVIGLIVIWVVFQLLDSSFLSPDNLQNLAKQMAATGLIALGIVLVLLLGQIDLSVGSVSGVTSAIMAVLNVETGMAAVPAIVLALLAGAVIGAIHGFFLTKVGVPAFVVTLAGLIGWSGLQLAVLGAEGTVNIPYSGGIAALANTYFTIEIGLMISFGLVAVYVIGSLLRMRRRREAELETGSPLVVGVKAAGLLAALLVVTFVMDAAGGMPLALIIFGGFVLLFDVMLRRTVFGRQIYATGGNTEAARRAGIRVDRVKTLVMIIASTMAAVGGILAASRLYAVNQDSGASDVLLNAIAAAVIGGTSLFGGRGTAYSALLGILVIQSITNGMFLLDLGSDVRFMITGAVLLAAVSIDAFARRGQRARGLG